MSNSINRSDFARDLASEGGYLDVENLDADTRQALHDAGVTDAQLAHIAGKGGEIAGAEFERLFDRLDRKDKDGNPDTVALETPDGQKTPAGVALAELQAEIRRNRAAAGNEGIIHLGMRPQSSREAEALRATTSGKQGGVHEIRAYQQGSVRDGNDTFDLNEPADIQRFVAKVGLKGTEAAELGQTLRFADRPLRDEMARLALALRDVGNGTLHANRLVLSGHGDGTNLVDDNDNWLRHDQVRDVVRHFPAGAGKIEDLAFSSCFSGTNPREWKDWKSVFPNVKSVYGYTEFSPSAERGAPRDLQAWDRMSKGHDARTVDPRGPTTATWNAADGDQNVPSYTAKQCEAIATRADVVLARYAGAAHGAGRGDPAAMRAYVEVSQAVNAANLPADLKARLDHLKRDLFPITHR